MSWLGKIFNPPCITLRCRDVACAMLEYFQGQDPVVVTGTRASDGIRHCEVRLGTKAYTLHDWSVNEIPFTEFKGNMLTETREQFLGHEFQ